MPKCGAKTRNGTPCQRNAVKGGTRCKFHGGTSPGAPIGNDRAAKPGSLYSKFRTAEERSIDWEAERGRIDSELDLARLMLHRLLTAQKASESYPELEEITERGEEKTERKLRRRDYFGMIDKCLARVASLERDREALINVRLDAELKRRELAKLDDENSSDEVVSSIAIRVVTNGS